MAWAASLRRVRGFKDSEVVEADDRDGSFAVACQDQSLTTELDAIDDITELVSGRVGADLDGGFRLLASFLDGGHASLGFLETAGKVGVNAMARKPWRKRRNIKRMSLTQSQIGKWLSKARDDAGKSQRDAATLLDTDTGTISRWENGKQPMSAEALFQLVRFYEAEEALPELIGLNYESLGERQTRALIKAFQPGALKRTRAAESSPPAYEGTAVDSSDAKPPARKRKGRGR